MHPDYLVRRANQASGAKFWTLRRKRRGQIAHKSFLRTESYSRGFQGDFGCQTSLWHMLQALVAVWRGSAKEGIAAHSKTSLYALNVCTAIYIEGQYRPTPLFEKIQIRSSLQGKTLKSGCLSLLTIRSFSARDGLGLSVRVW
eukprot:sb/3474108/